MSMSRDNPHTPIPMRACFGGAYAGKRVLVTGHTGFKGSWLCEWLLELGAEVSGFSLPPATTPALFDQLGIASRMRHVTGDVRDLAAVRRAIEEIQPDFVFHLAAQALVRHGYDEPVETFATNIMGTANVLEALRLTGRPAVVVVVTTDKCYENREWAHAYREADALGGHDPYSASKAGAEIVAAAYRKSFFTKEGGIRLATARAGNVIGGGDWAADRIVPDCVRALLQGRPIPVRNRISTRPWQHVLEPLGGYLWLGSRLADRTSAHAEQLASSFNFGPDLASNRTVAALVEEVLKHLPGSWLDRCDSSAPHEAQRLNLAIDKAHHVLGWHPVWSFEQAVSAAMAWYREVAREPGRAGDLTRLQVREYVDAAERSGLPWASTVTKGNAHSASGAVHSACAGQTL